MVDDALSEAEVADLTRVLDDAHHQKMHEDIEGGAREWRRVQKRIANQSPRAAEMVRRCEWAWRERLFVWQMPDGFEH